MEIHNRVIDLDKIKKISQNIVFLKSKEVVDTSKNKTQIMTS